MADDNYPAPSWSQAPSAAHTWKLVEIKSGTEVGSYDLTAPCVVLGRASDMVDITLAHESCSRRHARIAFDARGVPWLRDLGATHGTTVNKKSLPALAIGKVEDSKSTKQGARGVVLFPGDLLQFGASTRLYCLEGPREFERGAMKAMEQQRQAMPKEEVKQQAQQMEEEVEVAPKTLTEDAIPTQHRKVWEGLKAKRYKKQNLETESERIEAKGELTEGQQRQLERNQQRIANLQEEVDEIERELLNKIYPGEKQATGPKSLFNAAAEEDDVDDRTGDRHRSRTNGTETEESLTAKWKQCHSQHLQLKKSLEKAEANLDTLQEKAKSATDEEERFFLQNDVDLAKDVYQKANTRVADVIDEMKDTKKLLHIVNGKIITNLETGYIGTDEKPETKPMPPPSAMMPPPSIPPPSMPPPSMLPPSMPPPSMPPPSIRSTMPPPSMSPLSIRSTMPPPPASTSSSAPPKPKVRETSAENGGSGKRQRASVLVGPAMPPPKRRAQPQGTLSLLSATTTSSTTVSSAAEQEKKPSVPGFDSKKDEWKAPTGQDGSGRTKLNDKFAGRY